MQLFIWAFLFLFPSYSHWVVNGNWRALAGAVAPSSDLKKFIKIRDRVKDAREYGPVAVGATQINFTHLSSCCGPSTPAADFPNFTAHAHLSPAFAVILCRLPDD